MEPISVSAITERIKLRLEDLGPVTVEGEVSNARKPNASGHLYFTLGETQPLPGRPPAKLNAAFFRWAQQRQGDVPAFKDGDKVEATGQIAVYAPHGSYHLSVAHLKLCDGSGELLRRKEALQRKLREEGLCEATRKRPLPLLPRRIGIVTAPTGAAIRDILNILSRRYPHLHVLIAPCRVQGPEATEEIARAIELLNRAFGPDSPEPIDAMIVGRGGGSLEDLWCFNEERVARAVAASRIPVISAVGHEPDWVVTDDVADLRAPTPSAAAELICGRKEDFDRALAMAKERLINALRRSYREANTALQRFRRCTLIADPLRYLETRSQRIDSLDLRLGSALERTLHRHAATLSTRALALERAGSARFPQALEGLSVRAGRLAYALQRKLDGARAQLDARAGQLEHALAQQVSARQAALEKAAAQLEAFNPAAVLARGYAIVSDGAGKALRRASAVAPGAALSIRLAEGSLKARVEAQGEAPVADSADALVLH